MLLPCLGYCENAAMKMRAQIFFQISVFGFLLIFRSKIAGYYGSFIFNFLGVLKCLFWIIPHSSLVFLLKYF